MKEFQLSRGEDDVAQITESGGESFIGVELDDRTCGCVHGANGSKAEANTSTGEDTSGENSAGEDPSSGWRDESTGKDAERRTSSQGWNHR